ncbi:MAG: Tfx family DNA-binding protein [Candidatus Bathyarchaeia archaeon]
MRSKGTILTKRQWQVMQLRAKGLTQAQVAKRLRTTRENVTILEHRAHYNVKAARATLAALEQLSKSNEMIIPSGTSIFEATSMILLRGDILHIKLNRNADSLLALLRSKGKGKMRGHHLTSTIRLSIQKDGSVIIFRGTPSDR